MKRQAFACLQITGVIQITYSDDLIEIWFSQIVRFLFSHLKTRQSISRLHPYQL